MIEEKPKIAIISVAPVSKKIIALLKKENYEVIEVQEPKASLDILEALVMAPEQTIFDDTDLATMEQMERAGEVRDLSNPRGIRKLLHRKKK